MNNTILASVMIFSAFLFWVVSEWYGRSRGYGIAPCFSGVLHTSISYHQGAGCSLVDPHPRWRCSSFFNLLHSLPNLQQLATCYRQCRIRANMAVNSMVVHVVYVLRLSVLCD